MAAPVEMHILILHFMFVLGLDQFIDIYFLTLMYFFMDHDFKNMGLQLLNTKYVYIVNMMAFAWSLSKHSLGQFNYI